MTSGIDPWADVREHPTLGGGFVSENSDFAHKFDDYIDVIEKDKVKEVLDRFLTDTNALLAVVKAAQWFPTFDDMRRAYKWSKANDKHVGDYPSIKWGAQSYIDSERWGKVTDALAALPEHLK